MSVIKSVLRPSTDFTLQAPIKMTFIHEAPCSHCWISLWQLIFHSKVDSQCIVGTARPKFIPISMYLHRSPTVIPASKPSKNILPSMSTSGVTTTFESIAAAGMGIDSRVSLSLLKTSHEQSKWGFCRAYCQLLARVISSTISRTKEMLKIWWPQPYFRRNGHDILAKEKQGDKSHFLLSLNLPQLTLITLGFELVIENHQRKNTFLRSNSGKPLSPPHKGDVRLTPQCHFQQGERKAEVLSAPCESYTLVGDDGLVLAPPLNLSASK